MAGKLDLFPIHHHPLGALARWSLALCPYPQLFKGKFFHCTDESKEFEKDCR